MLSTILVFNSFTKVKILLNEMSLLDLMKTLKKKIISQKLIIIGII